MGDGQRATPAPDGDSEPFLTFHERWVAGWVADRDELEAALRRVNEAHHFANAYRRFRLHDRMSHADALRAAESSRSPGTSSRCGEGGAEGATSAPPTTKTDAPKDAR